MIPKPFLSARDMNLTDGNWYVSKHLIDPKNVVRDDFVFIEDMYSDYNSYYNTRNRPLGINPADYRKATIADLKNLIRNLYIDEDGKLRKHIYLTIDGSVGLIQHSLSHVRVFTILSDIELVEDILKQRIWYSNQTGYIYNNGKFAEIVDEENPLKSNDTVVSKELMDAVSNYPNTPIIKLDGISDEISDEINAPTSIVENTIFCKDDSEFTIPNVEIKPIELPKITMRFCIDED